MKNQGTVLATLVTTLLLGLVGIFTPTAAWAASVTVHPQTYVSTIQHRAKIVGPLETASLPIGSRPRAPGYDQNSTRSCCATGVGVTGGGPKFLRTLSGRRSHAYDLAANNTSASSSQPSPATASRGRESVGSSSVDTSEHSGQRR